MILEGYDTDTPGIEIPCWRTKKRQRVLASDVCWYSVKPNHVAAPANVA
jgi:hypothetical protein